MAKMERMYTLAEAQQELRMQECREHGHDFGHVVTSTGTPTKVLCERCGYTWAVVQIMDEDGRIGSDVEVLIENIAGGKADGYLEAILAATHGRKRALRGCDYPYGRKDVR